MILLALATGARRGELLELRRPDIDFESGLMNVTKSLEQMLSKGVSIPAIAKRLGHANANITLSIYALALEADELAAAKYGMTRRPASSPNTNGNRSGC